MEHRFHRFHIATSAVTTTLFDDLFFSAGTDATGAYTVTLNANQSADALNFQEGIVTLKGNGTARTLTLGTGGITVAAASGAVTLGDGNAVNNILLSLTSGQQTWANYSASDFTINNTARLFHAATGSTLTFTNSSTGLFKMSTTVLPNANGIIGPWSFYSSAGTAAANTAAGYNYAFNNAGTIAAYTSATASTWGGSSNSATRIMT